MVGVKRGAVKFDVKAHAVPFDREVEPMIPDENVSLRSNPFLQESLVQREFQRTVEAGHAKAMGICCESAQGVVVGKACTGVSDDDEAPTCAREGDVDEIRIGGEADIACRHRAVYDRGEVHDVPLVALETVSRGDLQRLEVSLPEGIRKLCFDEACLRAIGRNDPDIASESVVGWKVANNGLHDPVRFRHIHAASPARSPFGSTFNAYPQRE